MALEDVVAQYAFGFPPADVGAVEVFGERFGQTNWNDLRKVIGVINHTVADWIQEGETALEIVVGGIHSQINVLGPDDQGGRRHGAGNLGGVRAEQGGEPDLGDAFPRRTATRLRSPGRSWRTTGSSFSMNRVPDSIRLRGIASWNSSTL